MKIRRTTENDFKRIMDIYAHARQYMAETGNPNQWGPTNWPPENLIHKDITAGKSYVCVENDRIIGTFFFDYGKNIEPTYENIENGSWSGSEEYGVIHRIASDGSTKGTGAFCINWAYEQCGHLRIDTHVDNVVMQNLFRKLGFKKCGIIYVVQDNDPRVAYEKE